MNIPLINSNSKQDINTSLIAIRNAINELSRVKESESVEDLQRQINIINQQISNFNSEFSAINTHLNTIDTNILNLQPVDTVASGNLHSVTSNAVAEFNETVSATITKVPNVLNGNNFYASRSANVVQITLYCDSGSNIQSGVITKVATVSPKPKMFTEFSCQCDLVLINGMYVQPYQRMFLNTDGDLYIFVATPDGQPYTANVFSGGCYLV